MRCGQRTFRPNNKEDQHTCLTANALATQNACLCQMSVNHDQNIVITVSNASYEYSCN